MKTKSKTYTEEYTRRILGNPDTQAALKNYIEAAERIKGDCNAAASSILYDESLKRTLVPQAYFLVHEQTFAYKARSGSVSAEMKTYDQNLQSFAWLRVDKLIIQQHPVRNQTEAAPTSESRTKLAKFNNTPDMFRQIDLAEQTINLMITHSRNARGETIYMIGAPHESGQGWQEPPINLRELLGMEGEGAAVKTSEPPPPLVPELIEKPVKESETEWQKKRRTSTGGS